MQSKAATVADYLASLPADRRAAIAAVRDEIRRNLDPAIEEGMQYGMIGYFIPHRVYPAGYHCDPRQPLPFAGLGSQKNHMSVYMMCQYGRPEEELWIREQFAKAGKKLDMGKACIRFKKLDDLALPVIGKAIKRTSAAAYIKHYESVLAKGKTTSKKLAASKAPAPKPKKPAGKAAAKPAKKPAKRA